MNAPISGKQSGNLFKLDTNKSNEENIKEIIQGLYLKKPFQNDISPTSKNVLSETKLGLRGMPRNSSDSRRLSYLNALVTLLCKEERINLGFTSDELMTWSVHYFYVFVCFIKSRLSLLLK